MLGAWCVVFALACLAIPSVRFETSTGSVLDREGEDWEFYQASQRAFGGDELITVLIEASAPYEIATLRAVNELSEEFARIDGVRRVDSLATVPLIVATDSMLSLEPSLKGVESDQFDVEALRDRLHGDRVSRRTLVSDDGRDFAFNLMLSSGAETKYQAILDQVDEIRAPYKSWRSGVPVFRKEADLRTRRELMLFVPSTVAVVGIILFALFSSIRAVLLPLLVAGAGTVAVMAAMALLGTPITIATVLLPSVLLALGAAYAMHMLVACWNCSTPDGVAIAATRVALPIALSGLTTAIGFVAIGLVRIDAIRDVGSFGAIGVLVELAGVLTALPAALALWPVGGSQGRLHEWIRSRLAPRLSTIAERRSSLAFAAWGALFCAGVAGAVQINVETDVTRWFPRNDPIREDYLAIRERLSGISPINIVISSSDGSRVTSAASIHAMAGLESYLESNESVGRALSLADPIAQLHEGFSGVRGGDLPRDDSLVEQYLLLLEAKPYLRDLVTPDRSWANVLVRVDDNRSSELVQVARLAEAWWRENGPKSSEARATGIMYEFGRSEDEIALGQLRGLGFASVALAVILILTFGSVRLGLITFASNVVPIVVGFGVMGWLGIPIDAGTVVVGSLALGIAIDDSVHLVTAYQRDQLWFGQLAAVRAAMSEVAVPLVFTTVVVAAGFLVLGASSFALTRTLGVLTGGVVTLCLAADLLLLPGLLAASSARENASKAIA